MYQFYMAGAENIWIWVVIAVLVLLLFGGSKIPEMMKGLGTGVRELKKGMREDSDDDELSKEKEKEAKIRARVEEEMRREDEARRSKGVS